MRRTKPIPEEDLTPDEFEVDKPSDLPAKSDHIQHRPIPGAENTTSLRRSRI